MSKSTATPAVKEARTIRLVRAPSPCLPGKMVITEDGESITYLFSRMETQIGGVAWKVSKVEFSYEPLADGSLTMAIADSYDVLLDGNKSSCTCKWGIYGAYKKPCRHVSGILKLIADGKLS